ncbi:DHA2 family efflux MFS transporter permease subunit [Nocardia sp. CDC160]|uniref:DHA2 family efflux MFS transporter permease subunit n=1 Tax=Nocardia sp. CDC160 TaxID=3112166 RepID=UPI002DBDBBF1|nr:DHA2 family efflux MFS transporter permease subunit [Nocardia sp. CDC160]MEC3914724.1 DHA2 family efflux MFS transporter permease subunit [Nocardia sp. CDC160]
MRKWLPLLAACLGSFMLLIDVTIVNVALPDIAADLGTGLSGLQWVIDGYALALAALLLMLGSLADRFGAKPTYLIGLALFAAASLGCGVAGSAEVLVAARAAQGIGGAAMLATTLSLLHATYTGRDRGIAFSAWGAVSGAAAGVGVVLGGVLTDLLSWRWIFFVNLPIAVLAIALSAIAFGPSPRRAERRVDVVGMLAFTAAATAVTYGVIRAGEHGWGDRGAAVALIGGAIALIAFVLIESFSTAPMLPLPLLRSAGFTATLIAAVGMSFAAFASSPLLSLWLQQYLHLTPLRAGLSMLPLSVCAFLVSGVFGRLLHDVAPKWTIGGGLALIGAGSTLLTIIDTGSSWAATVPGYLVIGVGVGIMAPPLVAVGLAAVPPQQSGTAAGAINTARQLGLALGVAVLGTVFRNTGSGKTPDVGFIDGLNSATITAGVTGILAGALVFALYSRADRTIPAAPAAAPEPAHLA